MRDRLLALGAALLDELLRRQLRLRELLGLLARLALLVGNNLPEAKSVKTCLCCKKILSLSPFAGTC